MTRPLVSVVVPTLRAAEHLPRMIDSVCAQTMDAWELIIVDGCSGDGTDDVVSRYRAALADRLVFIEAKDAGCCAARNRGMSVARGDFIAFLDADDEFLPNKLERQLALLELRKDVSLVYSDYTYIDERGTIGGSVFANLLPLAREVPFEDLGRNLRVCDEDVFHYLIRGYFIATIVGMVRREVIAAGIRFVEDHPHAFAEWVFYLDIVRRFRAGYVNERLCRHHFTNGSITRTSKLRNSIAHRRLLLSMLNRFGEVSAAAREAIRRQLAETCEELGLQSYQRGDFAAAARYFAETCQFGCTLGGVGRLAKSLHRHLSGSGMNGLRDSRPLMGITTSV